MDLCDDLMCPPVPLRSPLEPPMGRSELSEPWDWLRQRHPFLQPLDDEAARDLIGWTLQGWKVSEAFTFSVSLLIHNVSLTEWRAAKVKAHPFPLTLNEFITSDAMMRRPLMTEWVVMLGKDVVEKYLTSQEVANYVTRRFEGYEDVEEDDNMDTRRDDYEALSSDSDEYRFYDTDDVVMQDAGEEEEKYVYPVDDLIRNEHCKD